MKKQQLPGTSASSKDSQRKARSVPSQEMASSVVKRYDDLIRCTNVLTEGIENGIKGLLFLNDCPRLILGSVDSFFVVENRLVSSGRRSSTPRQRIVQFFYHLGYFQ